MLSWFVSVELINYYLPKLKAGANNWSVKTEFNNCFIIRSPSLFFNEYLREAKWPVIFHARAITERRKAWFCLCMQPNTVGWPMMTNNGRPLFVGSYLQVTWWALGQWKRRTICTKSYSFCFFFRISNQALLSQMKHLKNWRTAFVVLLLQLVLYSLLCFFYHAPVVGSFFYNYLVQFSLCSSLFCELPDNGVVKSLQFCL